MQSRIACSSPPAGDRRSLRSGLLTLRKRLDPGWRRTADAAIADRLRLWLAGQAPGVLAMWWPLSGEPDLRPVFGALAADGWTIVLPRVVAPGAALAFGRWRPGTAMQTQAYGVSVPDPFEALVPGVVVAPCLGFDPRGWRLGYGGGYYDRTLAVLDAVPAGVAYDACERAFQPAEHDRPLSVIVTESRLVRCEPR